MRKNLSLLDYGNEPVKIKNKNRWLAGVNVAYSKKILQEIGGFPTALGRKKQNLISCEENYIHEILFQRGFYLYYHPKIKVKHYIFPNSLIKSWHLKRKFWNGYSLIKLEESLNRLSYGKRLKEIKKILSKLILLYINDILSKEKSFEKKCVIQTVKGKLLGLIK